MAAFISIYILSILALLIQNNLNYIFLQLKHIK